MKPRHPYPDRTCLPDDELRNITLPVDRCKHVDQWEWGHRFCQRCLDETKAIMSRAKRNRVLGLQEEHRRCRQKRNDDGPTTED